MKRPFSEKIPKTTKRAEVLKDQRSSRASYPVQWTLAYDARVWRGCLSAPRRTWRNVLACWDNRALPVRRRSRPCSHPERWRRQKGFVRASRPAHFVDWQPIYLSRWCSRRLWRCSLRRQRKYLRSSGRRSRRPTHQPLIQAAVRQRQTFNHQ